MKHLTSGFMSIEKRPLDRLLAAARHNRRAIAAELRNTDRINPERSSSNIRLRGAGTPEDIQAEMKAMLVGVPLRSDNKLLEVLFSLPAGTEIPIRPYFEACTTWAETHFRCHVLSSDVHQDEANPHCHVLLLPLRDGRMRGSDTLGYRKQLAAHHDSFYEQVGAAFGLHRQPPRLMGNAKKALAQAVLDQLKGARDAITKSAVWVQAQQAIKDNPQPWAEGLGLEMPERPKRLKSFTAIMTSPGKGPRWEEPTPIGFAALNGGNHISV